MGSTGDEGPARRYPSERGFVSESRLAAKWRRDGARLGLDIVAPFTANLPSGDRIVADVLVKNFGNVNGMLIFRNSDQVYDKGDAILEAGFGASVLEEPTAEEPFDMDSLVEMLRDWGWWGDDTRRPVWLGEDGANA
jgi:hypothetical protein